MNLVAEQIVQICNNNSYDVALKEVQRIIHGYEEAIRELQQVNRSNACRCTKGDSQEVGGGTPRGDIGDIKDSREKEFETREWLRVGDLD